MESFYQDEMYYISYKTDEKPSHLYKAKLDGSQNELLREYASCVLVYKDKVYYTRLGEWEDKEKYMTASRPYDVSKDIRVMNPDGKEEKLLENASSY